MKKHLIIFIFLAITGFLFFGNNIADQFVSDDWDWLQLSMQGEPVWKSFVGNYYGQHGVGGTFRPLINVVFELETRLFGLNPIGYHLISLLFHIASAFLVYLIALTLFNKKSFKEYVAVASGIIFTIMPQHTEAVVWIAAVADPLATFLYLLVFYMYINSRFVMGDDQPPLQTLNTALILLIFGLSLLSKEIALTFPALLLGYEVIIRQKRNIKVLVKRLWPFFFLAMLYVMYRYWAIGLSFGYYGAESLGFSIKDYVVSLINYDTNNLLYGNARIIVAGFISKVWYVYLSLIIIIVTWVGYSVKKKQDSKIAFLIYYWLLNVMLVLPLAMGVTHDEGERYGYISSVAVVILIAWGIGYVIEQKKLVGWAMLLIVTSYFGIFLTIKTNVWTQASMIVEDIRLSIEGIDFNLFKKSYIVGLPDNYYGAQVLRNGVSQLIALQGVDANVERVPVYTQLNNSNVSSILFNSIEKLTDGIHMTTANDEFIITGKATETVPEYKYELWNYNYDTFLSNTIRIQLRGGREFDFARNELQIVYFDNGKLNSYE